MYINHAYIISATGIITKALAPIIVFASLFDAPENEFVYYGFLAV